MKYTWLGVLLAANLVLAGCGMFSKSDDREYSEAAGISMERALRSAKAKVPGKAVQAKLDKYEGRVVYKIDIIDSNDKKRQVYVNAENGKVIRADKE